MRMQVILPFARPGSVPIGGGKKGEFRDWTIRTLIDDKNEPNSAREIVKVIFDRKTA